MAFSYKENYVWACHWKVAKSMRWPYSQDGHMAGFHNCTVILIFIVFVNQPFNDFTGYVEKGQLNNRTIYFKNEFS